MRWNMASKLQTKVLKYLKTLPKCWAVKVLSANERGCPDILCCIDGRFWAIEIKEVNDRISKIQQKQLDRIATAGGGWLVVRSLDDVAAVMNTTGKR